MAEIDEAVADAFLGEKELDAKSLKAAIRRQTLAKKFAPVFMGSALKNKGVQLLMDGVCDYLPAPYEVINTGYNMALPDKPKIEVKIDLTKEFIGYAFKLDESKFGQLTYMRVYQGIIRK